MRIIRSRVPRRSPMALVLLLGLVATEARGATVVIEDFEDVSDWSGLTLEGVEVVEGAGAGRWADVVERGSIHRSFDPPLDLSAYDHVGFWLHSAVANGQELQLVFDSEDDTSPGSDYYSTALRVDWVGWRQVWLHRDSLSPSRSPVGWDTIRGITVSASGWDHTPLSDTSLVFDQLVASNAVAVHVERREDWQGSDFVYAFEVTLQEPDGAPLGVDVQAAAPSGLEVDVQPGHVDLPADASAIVSVTVTVPAATLAAGPYLTYDVGLVVLTAAGGTESWIEQVATPPDPAPAPRVLLTADDFTRMDGWAAAQPWAADRRQRILDRAAGWPGDFLAEYGLGAVSLPPEGGQWGMHYVCPDHGANLGYEPPMTHRCPVDGATYAGWPYDQVIYARQHNDLARAVRDLGLAWQLTGDVAHATAAREILLAYADAYESYPIHSTQGDPSGSGARVLSQTLDESGWLVSVAWGYDLVTDSGVLDAAERDHVEQHLLRPAAAIIARNDAGRSNWQAWHNAAIAAAGRALEDPRLVARALHGPSGFHYHMAESVLADGFWYEGSWGYHFYTLSPMTYLAEMGERGQFPLYDDPALGAMYTSPIRFAPPDLVLPAFNDSGSVDLRGSAGWRLEAAYRATGEPTLLVPLVGESRPEEALFWGAETLPAEAPAVTESLLFEASGYAILRGGTADDPWWAALDFGPHGGWHGHYDKLGVVLFGRGRTLGLDPGSHSYALPLHDTWDRATVAHNTVVVDEAVQQEATGALQRFEALPGIVWVRADGGEAAPGVRLARDLVMVDGYVVDRFTADATDGQPHRCDWFWHADGALNLLGMGAPAYGELPAAAGYQHIEDAVTLAPDLGTDITFDWGAEVSYPGGLWSNDGGVVASQSYDSESHGGFTAVRLDYDFSAAGADPYITFRTRPITAPEGEVPTAVSVWIRGDGSGHSYRLRIVDATGESHVSDAAPLDFTGWQEVALEISGWSQWGGNDDGVIDLPLDNLVLQLDFEPGGPAVGAIHLDDWQLTFPQSGPTVVEDYEQQVARTRIWVAEQPDTTLVAGRAIGPDLGTPVDLVLVRRQGERATFDVLHEPYGRGEPAVERFEVTTDAAAGADVAGYRITTASTDERLLIVGVGAGASGGGPERPFGDHASDGLLARVRTTASGSATGVDRVELTLVDGSYLAGGGQDLFRAPRPVPAVAFSVAAPQVEILAVEGELADARLLAPGTTRVTLDGQDVAFEMDGDYVVFGQLPGAEDPDAGGCGCRQAGPAPALSFALLLLLWLARRRRAAGPVARSARAGAAPVREPGGWDGPARRAPARGRAARARSARPRPRPRAGAA